MRWRAKVEQLPWADVETDLGNPKTVAVVAAKAYWEAYGTDALPEIRMHLWGPPGVSYWTVRIEASFVAVEGAAG